MANCHLDHGVPLVFERHVREQFVDPRSCLRFAEPNETRVQPHVLDDRQPFIQRIFLRDHTESLLDRTRVSRRVVSKHGEVTRRAQDNTIEAADEGGFAGAIRPNQTDAFASADLKVQALQRGKVTKLLVHPARANHRVYPGRRLAWVMREEWGA